MSSSWSNSGVFRCARGSSSCTRSSITPLPTVRWRRMHRSLTWLFPLSRLKSVSERKLIDAAQGAVEFQLLRPSMTPLGYRLAHLDLVPGCRDLATFVFLGPRDRSFVLSQRPCYVPLT